MDVAIQMRMAMVLRCDNQSCMAIARNILFHACTIYIEIQYHYEPELIDNETMELKYCQTSRNIGTSLQRHLA